jgi:hypothetical protein
MSALPYSPFATISAEIALSNKYKAALVSASGCCGSAEYNLNTAV